MPITSSAKKALRGSLRKRALNDARRDAVRSATKAVKLAEQGAAKESVALAYKAIDKAPKRCLIKKQTAARTEAQISRMAKGK